jgi:recombination protein RecT
MTTTTALAKPPQRVTDIRSYIQSDIVKKQIAMVLPKHLTADVMARVVCTAILKTPKLAECRLESLLQSVMLLSQFGLLPDGRNAHLVPYFNTKANATDCQAIIDWKGKVARAKENGVLNICPDIVCENDRFTWKMTPDGLQFEHEIDYRKPERGPMFAAYCVWKDGGSFSGVIMSKLEIDAIRRRSKAASSGPWVTDYTEQAKKTVVHRASKLWPLDAEFDAAIEVQEAAEAVVDLPALPAAGPDDTGLAGDNSNAELAPAPAAETSRQFITRTLTEAGVTFDDGRSVLITKNIAKDADAWASWDDAPDSVFDVLVAQPKTMAEIVKKFGNK